MKKYITILSLIVLAACTRDGIPDVPDDGGFTDIALTYTIQTEITSDVHGSTKSDSGISLGSCDIWCFVYDRGAGTWVDGFPAIQTGTDGNRYLFRIPKLDYARLRFVIMSEDIEYSYEGGDIVFSSPDMSAEGSYLYSTDAIELSTNTGRIVNINGKLIQRHYDLNLGFEFNNFNISPEDYFAGWTFELTDKEGNIYPYGKMIDFSALSKETDSESGKEYYKYHVSAIIPSLQFLMLYFDTADGIVYGSRQSIADRAVCKVDFIINYNYLNY